MNNSTTTYKRLGDYIREVDVRNSDLSVSKLVGLTIAKAFIPSVANTIGTDLSKYKIIRENQFACSLMQVSRDGKMPIAIYKGENAIMSPAYPVFEVYKEGLLPDYLQMWFSRPEFDREAVFYAVGGVRGSLDWNDFMDMMLPVPPIEEQQRIVDRYNAIKNRIETNKQTIAKLEEAAQALYRKMFVDNIDPNNLPAGWRMGTLGEVLQEKGYIRGPFGSALKKEDMLTAGIPVYEQQHIIDKHRKFRYFISEEKYSQLKRFSVKENDIIISCSGTIGEIELIKKTDQLGVINQALLILRVNENYSPILLKYFFTSSNGRKMLLEETQGSAQVNIAKREQIERIPIIIPNHKTMRILSEQLTIIDGHTIVLIDEIKKLTELQSLLLAKMGR